MRSMQARFVRLGLYMDSQPRDASVVLDTIDLKIDEPGRLVYMHLIERECFPDLDRIKSVGANILIILGTWSSTVYK